MAKKYKLDTTDTITVNGKTLYRIVALISFASVVADDRGGYIEDEGNLSQCGDAWVSGNAKVYGDAQVSGNAKVSGDAWVYGNAQVYGNAKVYGDAQVSGNAKVSGDAWVYGGKDYFCTQSFGSRGRTTTFFREENGWRVNCGCFSGTIEDFRQKVKETHGDSLVAQEYLMIADLMELRIKRVEQETKNEAE